MVVQRSTFIRLVVGSQVAWTEFATISQSPSDPAKSSPAGKPQVPLQAANSTGQPVENVLLAFSSLLN
jgi:hypothetical protein